MSAPRLNTSLLSLVALGLASFAGAAIPTVSETDPAAQAHFDAAYGRLPLSFEANQGQTDRQVRFLSRGPGYTLFLTSTQAVLSLAGAPKEGGAVPSRPATARPTAGATLGPCPAQLPKARGPGQGAAQSRSGAVLRMSLEGANPTAAISGKSALPGKVNYLLGKDPRRWRTGIETYGKVHYSEVYPGIDLVYYGNQRQLEHDFIVAPGSDPARIRLAFDGAKDLSIDPAGSLSIDTGGGKVSLQKPVVYQEIGGSRKDIAGAYALDGERRVGFRIAAWDRNHPLVIDPVVLSCATYIAGSGVTRQFGFAVDASGQAYVTGDTQSPDYPVTPANVFQPVLTAGEDAFVAKLNASGEALVYATYLGGTVGVPVYPGDENVPAYDLGRSIAVDGSGHAYVAGITSAADFPTTAGAYQRTQKGSYDAFVTKVNPDGTGLVYSTYLGDSSQDFGLAIAVDAQGQAYVAGTTYSPSFPTTPGAFQGSLGGSNDAFVTKLSADGSNLVYSTFLGGNTGSGQFPGEEQPFDIAIDTQGRAYVAGNTTSANFPLKGAIQPTYGGTSGINADDLFLGDAFVTRLNAIGSDLEYSTYLGGSDDEGATGIAVDASFQTFVVGVTESSNFPTTAGAFQSQYAGGPTGDSVYGDNGDGFVTKLNAAGSALVYSTYLGGNNADRASSVAVDTAGRAYVFGQTNSADFPTTEGAFQRYDQPDFDVFLAQIKADGSGLDYSTYLGGSGSDTATDTGVVVDAAGQVYVAGMTSSSDFPTTTGAFQVLPPSGMQLGGFVAKFTGFTSSTFTFKAFKVDRLKIDRYHKSFFLDADFTLAKASDGLKPKSEPLTLKVGQFTLNIPAGSFRTTKYGRFSFQGKIGKLYVKVILSPKGYKRYGIEATVSGVDLRKVCWKKTAVELKIGNDSGRTWTKPRC